MKKHWRPENWNNPYRTEEVAKRWSGLNDDVPAPYPWIGTTTYEMKGYKAFEVGADAMLEALKKQGVRVTESTVAVTAPIFEKANGWLVFIEEEEDDGE